MFKVTSIRQQAALIGAVLFGIVGVQLAVSAVLGVSGLRTVQAFITYQSKDVSGALQLQQSIADIRYDVIQVQQNLTDLSATRGLNGLDDGRQLSAEFAAAFERDLRTAQGLATQVNDSALMTALAEVQTAFTPYYELGRKMAEAYVQNGPEAGNAMMAQFDTAAQSMTTSLEKAATALQNYLQVASSQAVSEMNGDQSMIRWIIGFNILLGVGAIGVIYLIVRALRQASQALSSGTEVARRAAEGDLNARNIRIGRRDEIGELLDNINQMLDMTEAFTKESEAAMSYVNKRKYYRRIIPTGLRGGFVHYANTINETLTEMAGRDSEVSEFVDRNVRQVAETVATAAANLNGHITTIGLFSDETREKAGSATGAATRTTQNMQTVAAAIEELSASINEISSQMSNMSGSAEQAVKAVADTDAIVTSLAKAAARIGSVVELINDIAGQTNLLALNATIEAARAGDAGKGFAVVASEVMNLATQTSKSTEEITQQVNAVQAVVKEVSQAIEDIGGRVRNFGDISAAVAAAVEEQRAVTESISGNVSDVTNAANDVTHVMDTVSITANETNTVVQEISGSSSFMASEADRLRQQIGGFMEKIKAVG